MYNSKNLPLSKKKIIKKIIPTVFPMFIAFAILKVVASIFAETLLSEFGSDAAANFFANLPTTLLSLWLTVLVGAIGYEYAYYKLYYYNFEQKDAEIKKGVVGRSMGVVRYNQIQDLFVDQDLLDGVLGLYDVHYETKGDSTLFYYHIDGLNKKNADKLLDFLRERMGNLNEDKEEKKNIAKISRDAQKK